MYYYLMVNVAHQYHGYSREKAKAWMAGLPRRRMRPQDWSLPAEVEAKFENERIGGWHDYGNQACAASLARSQVPGAERMYRFVRAAMDHDEQTRGRGRRNRAVEFVK
jgi:hypothetical protein